MPAVNISAAATMIPIRRSPVAELPDLANNKNYQVWNEIFQVNIFTRCALGR
jgi:hypothetical protein